MITITVSGESMTGKSSLCIIIAQFLWETYGIDSIVRQDSVCNHATCHQILCAMKGQTIEITEVHTQKGDIHV